MATKKGRSLPGKPANQKIRPKVVVNDIELQCLWIDFRVYLVTFFTPAHIRARVDAVWDRMNKGLPCRASLSTWKKRTDRKKLTAKFLLDIERA